jgi:hypothetical protein
VSRKRGAIVDFPVPVTGPLAQVVDILRAAFGRTVSLGNLCLLADNAGVANVGAVSPGTAVATTRTVADFADAGVDQVRVVGYGMQGHLTNAAYVTVYDTTNTVEIARASLAQNVAGRFTGSWTKLAPESGDRNLEVRTIGNGANTQTLYNVHLQYRTTRFQQ